METGCAPNMICHAISSAELFTLQSTADIYTYTPIIKNTVYIVLSRHCKHLLVVVYKFLSDIQVSVALSCQPRLEVSEFGFRHTNKQHYCLSLFLLYYYAMTLFSILYKLRTYVGFPSGIIR